MSDLKDANIDLNVFETGEPNLVYADYFNGATWLKMLETEQMGIGNIVFEPGCRNNWHVHHKGGQILLVTAGEGWYQAWGEPARRLKPGDVVSIEPEVKHWHGAAKDSWFVHIFIGVPSEGGGVEWLEPVNDDDYNQL